MSEYKFHKINSNAQIIRRLKFDLWGNILLTKKNKYSRIFSQLYKIKRKRFYYKNKSFLLKKMLVLKNNKLLYSNKYNYFYFKKLMYLIFKKNKNKNYKNLIKLYLKNINFLKIKRIKSLNFLKKIQFKKRKNKQIKKHNIFGNFVKNFKNLKKIKKELNKLKFSKILPIYKKQKKKFFILEPYIYNMREIRNAQIYRFRVKRKKVNLKKSYILKKKRITKKFYKKKKKKYNKLNDFVYLLKNKYNNHDFYILKAKYGGYVPKYFKNLTIQMNTKIKVYEPIFYKSIFNIKSIELFKKRKKLTKFGRALKQKESLRRFLGNCSNKQLKAFFYYFKNNSSNFKTKNIIQKFFINFESTLVFFLIRTKFFLIQLHFLKNFILKNGVLVNNKLVNDPYFRLKVDDKITFPLHLYKYLQYNFLKNFSKYSKTLSHILINYSNLSFNFIKLPNLKELDYGFKFNSNLFRQFFYKNKFKFNKIKIV